MPQYPALSFAVLKIFLRRNRRAFEDTRLRRTGARIANVKGYNLSGHGDALRDAP